MIRYLKIPVFCPYCNSNLIIKKDNQSKFLFCPNENCNSRLLNKIEHFFGKKGIDAKGISKATIEKLINKGWVNSIKDIFTLEQYKDEWIKLEGFGEKSVNKILDSIKNASNCELEKLICAAGIPLIGTAASKEIVKIYSTYKDFREAIKNNFDFSTIEGFGFEMNNSIINYNYDELDFIVGKYLNIKEKIAIEENKALDGLVFVITGKLKEYKNRDELKRIIEAAGGKVTGSVSKNTNYLINNDIESTSAKNKTAKSLNIPIITEEDFKNKFDF